MNETPNIINVNGENYVKMSSIPVPSLRLSTLTA